MRSLDYRAISLSLALLALGGGGGCSGSRPSTSPSAAPPRAAAPAEAQIQRCQGPCQLSTPGGATLQVPQGMRGQAQGAVLSLIAPEPELQVHLVELQGEDLPGAVRLAWQQVESDARLQVEQTNSPPAGGGFDAVYVESYVAQKDRHAYAVARRKDQRIWVSLIRGSAPLLDRRGAQINSFVTSMKAPGVEKLNLRDKPYRSIAAFRAELEAFVEKALQATGTPGLALAVVEGDAVVLARGFGVREQGKPAPVTPDTLMMIGSVSKSLTTLLMASLVDEGKLDWSRPVAELLPSFRLADAGLTGKLTVEQLVCACAGLPRKDLPLVLAFAGKRPRQVLQELAQMAPSTGLKETFQYQNHMVAAGGYLAAHVCQPGTELGAAYDRAMNQRVFAPLGMTATTLDFDRALRRPDRALPSSQDLQLDHRRFPVGHERFASYIRPSGGIWSTANDMARYLIAELQGGKSTAGRQVVSPENLTYRRKPQVAVSAEAAYGLGWLVAETKGLQLISHGGGTMGFATLLSFLPEKQLGVVMISNGTGGHLVEQVVWKRLLELWFSIEDNAEATLEHSLKQQRQALEELKKRLSPPPPDWLKPLLGTHHNAELGRLLISQRGGRVYLEAGEYKTELMRHDRPDGKAVLIFLDPPLAGLELLPLSGEQGSMEMRRAQERYIFARGER